MPLWQAFEEQIMCLRGFAHNIRVLSARIPSNRNDLTLRAAEQPPRLERMAFDHENLYLPFFDGLRTPVRQQLRGIYDEFSCTLLDCKFSLLILRTYKVGIELI